ncbi:MAG: polysaccharide biosynthesis protein [Gammaproteobacteria bacterium]|nr:polysaccharide biosynthesis protein [Gammaproteobacteria bacterium]MBT8437927.1 polysaccharide biosynthesis protein [Gammaproteobacteria bacterium]
MLIEELIKLPRPAKRLILAATDCLFVIFALWLSFSLRLGEFFMAQGIYANFHYLFLLAPALAMVIFPFFGLYRTIIRYIGIQAIWSIIKAVTIYSLAFGVVVLLIGISGIPRSVILINWLAAIILVGGSRILGRWWLTGNLGLAAGSKRRTRVAIYGAGGAGIQIATALQTSPGFKPVAFIDDNRSLQGNYIEGLPVHPLKRLNDLIEDLGITEVLLAMPSVARSRQSEIISQLEPFPVHVSTLPGLDDLASGRVKVDDIREVDISDLLGRDTVQPDLELLHANIKDKVVLVSGAGGSIGSELCRQIVKIGPQKLILYERGEHDLYTIENELIELIQRQQPDITASRELVTPILASILNQDRLESVCKAFGVQTIYHAAAYKHVPMVERNPSEAVRNNVLGTYKAAMAAIAAEVETFVLISTDKAVRPTSTMGATKRFAEMILQALTVQGKGKTRFTMVRFGNVLGSSGSVVPLFREQIQKGGPVTVTDPKIIRYFMTIPEAAQLVIQAGAMGEGGDVFVLDMGEPIKILDMAKRMIHLSGFEFRDETNSSGEIEIIYTGLRPGEKLYEELLIGENVIPTKHPLIMSANEDCLSWDAIKDYINKFEETVNTHDVERSRALLVESVKGFKPQCEVADLVREINSRVGGKPGKGNVIGYPG